jgi:hypothetical protein
MTNNQDLEGRPIPVAVKVFGILHTVFGSFGLVTAPFGFLNMDTSLALYQSLGMGDLIIQWLRISIIISPFFSIALLALGIGLLLKKPWGRSGSIIYGYAAIALAIINAIIFAISLSQATGAATGATDAGVQQATAIGGMIGGIFGALAGSIYPILTIIFMSKANVKAALERRAGF